MVPRSLWLVLAVPIWASACADDTTIPFGRLQADADAGDSGNDPGLSADTGSAGDPDLLDGAADPLGDTPPDVPADDGEADAVTDASHDISIDVGADTAVDLGEDATDASGDGGSGEVIRFVAFGDWGMSVTSINAAANAMWEHCQVAGCDFVIGLGDNFYDDGVTGVDDPQWQDKFEEPFADWDIPFYMSLGNHDYRGDEQAQVDYTDHSDKWTMPARYFDLVAGPAHFFALDTNQDYTVQRAWLDEVVPEADAPWLIGFGHHPWRSNGHYGDQTGTRRALLEWGFCDRVDFYLCGHEHDLQHLAADCGVEMVVSGGVVSTRETGSGENTLFATDERGFAWLELSPERAVVELRDREGNLLHRSERARRARAVACDADDYCAAGCAADPDCESLGCAADDVCEPRCPLDPDCWLSCPCDFNDGLCEPLEDPSIVRCGCDPECRGQGRPCGADDHCDTWCPEGIDPDCGL